MTSGVFSEQEPAYDLLYRAAVLAADPNNHGLRERRTLLLPDAVVLSAPGEKFAC